MKLHLQWHDQPQRPLRAALLTGGSPEEWLRQCAAWGISLLELKAYALPSSLADPTADGLLVVFGKSLPPVEAVHHPYGTLGGKLLLPCHAQVWPAVTPAEMDALLLYPRVVWHPSIGWVGFEESDLLPLGSLLAFAEPLQRNWSWAEPPDPPFPQQLQVQMPLPSFEEVLPPDPKVGDKPLSDLGPMPKDKPAAGGEGGGLAGGIGAGIIGGLAGLVGAAFYGLGRLFGDGGDRSGSNRNLDKERENALEKLLRLFDNNLEEALRYALPLSGGDAGRGVAPPGSVLGPRDTNFNLGNLGRSGPVDAWDIGKYQARLREKYLHAAAEAIRKGDYRRAAYIHAHLLGDFSAAANVLRQGKHYRESAALYRDRLQQPRTAAAVLEEGGHLSEALELWEQEKQWEKVGDLSRLLGQEERAVAAYQHAVQDCLDANDLVKAASLTQHKLNQLPAARDLLRRGWPHHKQRHECLRLFLSTGWPQPREMVQELKALHKETPHDLQLDLLKMLADQLGREERPALRQEGKEMAFAHVARYLSQPAGTQDVAHLSLLSRFVPEDDQLPKDIRRYLLSRPKESPKAQSAPGGNPKDLVQGMTLVAVHQLGSNFAWKRLWSQERFLFAFGSKREAEPTPGAENGRLAIMEQVNGTALLVDGQLSGGVPPHFVFVDRLECNLHTGGFLCQDKQVHLSANRPLGLVHQPWLPPRTLAVLHHSGWHVLHDHEGNLCLSQFTDDGELVLTVSLELSSSLVALTESGRNAIHTLGHEFYLPYSNAVLRVDVNDGKHYQQMVYPVQVRGISLSPASLWGMAVHLGQEVVVVDAWGAEPLKRISTPEPASAACLFATGEVALLLPHETVSVIHPSGKEMARLESASRIIGVAQAQARSHMAVLTADGRLAMYRFGRRS